MLQIVGEEILEGYKYTHYSNGTVVKSSINTVETKIPEPELTDMELLMQANANTELRDLEIQQNQELLAQQMADIELELLGGVS